MKNSEISVNLYGTACYIWYNTNNAPFHWECFSIEDVENYPTQSGVEGWRYMTTQGTVIEVSTEQAMRQYTEAYQKLYKRTPRDLRALGNDWVIVNGIRMHVGELIYLTKQLQQEYDQMMAQRRNIVMRLLTWLK